MRTAFFILILTIVSNEFAFGQAKSQQAQINELKQEILNMRIEVQQMQQNLELSRKKFKNGLLVATIGYAVTITGGLMLGRQNDSLGKGLLVVGGVTGITGTGMMLDAFNSLSGLKKNRKR
jgi:hypothetical protein